MFTVADDVPHASAFSILNGVYATSFITDFLYLILSFFVPKKHHTNSKITFPNFLFYFLQKTDNINNNVKRVILAFFKLTKILAFNIKRGMLYPQYFHKTFTINRN